MYIPLVFPWSLLKQYYCTAVCWRLLSCSDLEVSLALLAKHKTNLINTYANVLYPNWVKTVIEIEIQKKLYYFNVHMDVNEIIENYNETNKKGSTKG